MEVLRAMNSLTEIWVDEANFRGKPAEFWKKYDAGEFK
jgi:hypothetical protein